MAVMASAEAQADGYAAQAVIDLCRSWSASGARVFLLDLMLDHPQVHDRLGQPRGEGVADAILFGSSIRRVARSVDGFFFASAGSPVAEPAMVYGAPRWLPLLDGFLAAGVTLVMLVPSDGMGLESLLSHATHTILLAGAGEDHGAMLGQSAGQNLLVTGPGREGGAPFEDEVLDLDVDLSGVPDEAVEWIEKLAREEERSPSSPQAIVPLPKGDPVNPARTRPVLWGVAAVVVVAAGGLLLWDGMREAPVVEEVPGAVVEVEAPPATPGGTVQEFSIAMGSYSDATTAAGRAAALAEQVQEVLFVISPVEVDGQTFWRVLAGPAADSTDAEALRQVLGLEIGGPTSTVGADWVVRRTPLTFLLGEESSLSSANALADAMRDSGAPAYVLEVRYSDDSSRYHVYAGAFASVEEAEVLWREMESSFPDRPVLTDRLGYLPS